MWLDQHPAEGSSVVVIQEFTPKWPKKQHWRVLNPSSKILALDHKIFTNFLAIHWTYTIKNSRELSDYHMAVANLIMAKDNYMDI